MARLQQKGWPRKNRMEEHRGLQVFMGSAFALSQESWHFFKKIDNGKDFPFCESCGLC